MKSADSATSRAEARKFGSVLGLRFQTTTGKPERLREEATRLPIIPRPMTPTDVFRDMSIGISERMDYLACAGAAAAAAAGAGGRLDSILAD
jgi:hypothetical protein